MKYYLGIDLGGTNTKIGIVDEEGNVHGKTSVPTHIQDGPQQACARIAEGVRGLLKGAGLDASAIASAGLASAGPMDIPGRQLLRTANLGEKWHYCPICDMMSRACGFDVIFANDASAAAYAEYWVGKGKTATKHRLNRDMAEDTGKPITSMVLLTLGTGIGCGIILNRQVYDGEHSQGGEFGHAIIDYSPDARICGCGKPGHFEAYASATALIRHAQEAVLAGRETSLANRMEALREEGAKVVAEEANRGDKVAMELILNTAKFLAVGIVTLMHTIDPDAIYLGGAMTFGGSNSPLGRTFLQAVKDEVKIRALKTCALTTTLDFADLGGDAGFIGAAGIAKVSE
ncbi:MAG: ROK family protein [Planctomycetia bacterium]|nr:ROK family protein [Planctomycetia bacterium]